MHGDDEPYGSVQHVELFNRFPAKTRLPDVVSVMNRAATEDDRALVWPVVSKVLHGSPAPNALDQQVVNMLDEWVTPGRAASGRRQRRQLRRSGAGDHGHGVDAARARR